MIDFKTLQNETIHLVWIAGIPVGQEVVSARNEKEAIERVLSKYYMKCINIDKTNENNANCRVNDNYYFVTYC